MAHRYNFVLPREMAEENSTASHLAVAMTTQKDDNTQTVGDISWVVDGFYLQLVVVVIGVIGTAGNALILYALVASKQHKKHVLIVNQNALDLFSSIFLIISYAVKLPNIQLAGALGYWLCIILISDMFVWYGLVGSVVNLAIITIYRYLKVVHHTSSKKWMRPWMINSAMAFAWFVSIATNTPFVFETTGVIDGVCHSWVLYKSNVDRIASLVWYIVSWYIIILVIFVYCYGRILATIRRQARVMASHVAAGSSSSQTQSHKIQTNVIKTMILVSAFYAIAWLPVNVYYAFVMTDPHLTYLNSYWYASIFCAFLYTSANPFIYAVKFDPVKQFLSSMVLCKKASVEPIDIPLAAVRSHTGASERYLTREH